MDNEAAENLMDNVLLSPSVPNNMPHAPLSTIMTNSVHSILNINEITPGIICLPFKEHSFWPGSVAKSGKRPEKLKLPGAISSSLWRDMMKDKEKCQKKTRQTDEKTSQMA